MIENDWTTTVRERLEIRKQEINARLVRITHSVSRPLDSDSEERATQLEDRDVVEALGNEARQELLKIGAALQRIEKGEYADCAECGAPIGAARLSAYPYARECIDCAELMEEFGARSS